MHKYSWMQTKNKFNNLYETIQESLGSNYSMTTHSAENGGGMNVGGKGMQMAPSKMTMLDIIAGIEQDMRKKNPNAPVIGYPLQNTIPEDLGDVVVMLADITGRFKQAGLNPVIKNNPKALAAVKRIFKKLKRSGAIMLSIKHDLDDLVVEK